MEKILGLPLVASEHGQNVNTLVIYVHWLMFALFVGWLAYFLFTLWRFNSKRNPKADYVGVKNHATSYIEITVALIELFLLAVIAVPLWARAVDKFPETDKSTVIQIVAQQFDWNVRYPGKDGVFGRQDMKFVSDNNSFGVDTNDVAGRDDVQTQTIIHAVVDKDVIIYISSKDVIHSFKVISMRVTQDAIPGMRIPIHFKPTKVGTYQVYCAQLCGGGHAGMARGMLVVESQSDFDKWLAGKTPGAAVSLE